MSIYITPYIQCDYCGEGKIHPVSPTQAVPAYADGTSEIVLNVTAQLRCRTTGIMKPLDDFHLCQDCFALITRCWDQEKVTVKDANQLAPLNTHKE